jgi:two-component system, OmpR family, sensor kinase
MLFVADPKRATKRDKFIIHILPTSIIFLAFLSVSLWGWYTARNQVQDHQQAVIHQNVKQINDAISSRMASYGEILRASSGLFKASKSVSRTEWRTFETVFDIPHRYPGVQGISFVEKVPQSLLKTHIRKIRKEGFPDYSVHPKGTRKVYMPVTYIEPFKGANLRAFGYDIYTNPVRRAALDQASQTGNPVLSGKITLVQNVAGDDNPGFLICMPIYKHKAGLNSIQEREKATIGFATAPFLARQLFMGIFGSNPDSKIGFQIYDGEPHGKNLLYENELYNKIEANAVSGVSRVTVYGRDWVVVYRLMPQAFDKQILRRPLNTLIGGLLFSALVAGLVLTLLISRTRSLSYAEHREIQQAKDDVLSIASHQLRTPATGVKQYVGMLKEGFVGKLTKRQKEIINKAYESNERQLNIIDEMLYVARIDTGRLLLQPKRINFSELIREICKEQAVLAKSRKQSLHTHIPKKNIFVGADIQYIRMAIENIIENASKYNYPGGRVDVELSANTQKVILRVRDTGVGIEKEDFIYMFQKFSRIHNELSRKTAGSGVGLYVAERIITMHNGSITFTSKAGAGTTFVITLDRIKAKSRTKNV